MKRYLVACAGGVGFLCLLAGVLPLGAKPAGAEVTPSFSKLSSSKNDRRILLAQVTSEPQLSDVQPTDWAFQALQSLIERYGCIAGYPDATYQGNRALTRYEFAAGLNACIDRVNELIATATGDLVNKEDLATLQKLQEEFSTELAALQGRVDTLEARTAELETAAAQLTATLPEDRATPYHVEAYYRFQDNEVISVTPGAFVLFNPEGNSDNDTTTVGVFRTTYNF